jgi:deoxyribonuclease-4
VRLALHLDPPLGTIPERLQADGVDAFQTCLRDPHRYGKYGIPDAQDCDSYRAQLAAGPSRPWGIVHGSLLTNLASKDGKIRNSSLSSLLGDLQLAAELDLQGGVCFHAGYTKGHDTLEPALAEASRKLVQLVERMGPGQRAVIENACETGELGQTLAEVATLVRQTGAPAEKLGILIDTCHLHAAGFDLATPDAGERLANELAEHDLLPRLVGFHLNDSQGEMGCHRDRHAAPGTGTIGRGLLSIVNHEAFAHLPCVLELEIEAARVGLEFLRAG